MAIIVTLRGFNDLGRPVTPSFLSMDRFLYRFSTFCEEMKKIYRVEVLIFAKRSIEFVHLTSWFSCAAVSNASLRVIKVCENDGKI